MRSVTTSPSLPPPNASATATDPAPPTSDPDGGGWGASKSILGIVALLLVVVLESGVVAIFDPGLKSVGGKLVLQVMLAATLVAVAFFMAGEDSRPAPRAALGLRRPDDGARAAAGTALAAYGLYFVFAITYHALVSPHQKDLPKALGFNHGTAAAIVIGILVVAAAPISEEIFFRGFVFRGLRRGLSFVVAGVISALIFGAFHYTGPSSLTVLPQLAVLGLALAWIYERTGSIYPGMTVHAINNAFVFAILIS
jgi:CAAX protease family protein